MKRNEIEIKTIPGTNEKCALYWFDTSSEAKDFAKKINIKYGLQQTVARTPQGYYVVKPLKLKTARQIIGNNKALTDRQVINEMKKLGTFNKKMLNPKVVDIRSKYKKK